MPKRIAREIYQQQRRLFFQNLSHEQHKVFVQSIQKRLLQLPLPQHAWIGAYWPMEDEVDIKLIFPDLQNLGFSIALPFTHKVEGIVFYPWTADTDMHKDDFGIPSPSSQTAVIQPDIFLIPLVSFNEQCHRLGRGQGHYDRYLAHRSSHSILVGIALEFQKSQTLPIELHDIQLDYVITEKMTYRKNA